jgi:hypothetical protein
MTAKDMHTEWKALLDDFSRRNALRPARVEVIGMEVGAQEVGDVLPFVGASCEPKGSAAGSVDIILGGESPADPRHVNQRVEDVVRIVPYIDAAGLEQGLEVESADGLKTLVIFENLPELEA